MPPQPKSLSARLRQLEVAKARANALPRGAKLSFEPMRELLGLATRAALRDWCDSIEGFEASKAFVRGGNGVEWEFDPRKTVAFLLKHFSRQIEAQATRSRKIAKAVGVNLPAAETAPSLQETKQLVELTLTVTAAQEKMGVYGLHRRVQRRTGERDPWSENQGRPERKPSAGRAQGNRRGTAQPRDCAARSGGQLHRGQTCGC